MDYNSKPMEIVNNKVQKMYDGLNDIAQSVSRLIMPNTGLENKLVPVGVPYSPLNQPLNDTPDGVQNAYTASYTVKNIRELPGNQVEVTNSNGDKIIISRPWGKSTFIGKDYVRDVLGRQDTSVGNKQAGNILKKLSDNGR